jgi:hypothetical protein
MAAAALAALAGPAAAEVVVDAPGQTYSGAAFLASVQASDPGSVVLVEWDFDGDGVADANRTDGCQAEHRYRQAGSFQMAVTVTRQAVGGTTSEQAVHPVTVLDGTPTVDIVVPDRLVAGLEQEFRARASDKDPAPGGERFTFVWRVDGVAVEQAGATARLTVAQPGTHVITVAATDEEGVEAQATATVEFGAPGLFEGPQGTAWMALAVAAVAFAAGGVLVRASQRERRSARMKAQGEVAAAASQAAGRPGKPQKVPFQAAAEAGPATAPRIVLGGAPAALTNVKECPVCHNAIDADLDPANCPFCAANAKADALEASLRGARFDDVDLSQVRALMQRARGERHLGRTESNDELLAQAAQSANALVEERQRALEWLERAQRAVEEAQGRADAERIERAGSYLKLALSLAKARQYGKVARHARRCVEILTQGGADLDTPDRCHACAGAVAAARAAGQQRCPHCDAPLLPEQPAGADVAGLEADVRRELEVVREMLQAGQAQPDQEAWALLKGAEAFERQAAWSQALELLRPLRERFEREKDAAGSPQGPDGTDR